MEINPNNVRVARKVSDVQGDLRIDGYLTSFSLRFGNNAAGYIAGRASTNIPVLNESDKFATYPRGYFLRDEAEVRALGGRPVQVGYKVENDTYLAEEWALEHTIDDRQRRNTAAPVTLDENGVELLQTKQLIREDRIWCSKFFRTGVWTHEAIGTTDFTPFNDAASEPISVIDAEILNVARTTGMRPNTLIMGANVMTGLRSNADITDRIKYTQRGVADEALLASLFGVDRVLIANSIYNAANEGATDDFEFICDENSMLLVYISPSAGLNTVTGIARFAWTGLIPGATNNRGGVITRGRDDRAYSDWIHSRNAFDYKLVSPDVGVFFSNVVVPISN